MLVTPKYRNFLSKMLGKEEDVEDIIQNARLTYLLKLKEGAIISNDEISRQAYFNQILANSAMRFKVRAGRKSYIEIEDIHLVTEADQDKVLLDRTTNKEIANFADSLPPIRKKVFLTVLDAEIGYKGKNGIAVAAKELGINENTCKAHWRFAILALRENPYWR